MNPLPTKPNRWRTITVFNLLLGMLFSLSVLAQPAFLKDGLVAYYPFNGNANDESGNRKNPSNVQDGFTANAFGFASSAFSFVKSNERITIPNDPVFNLNSQGEFTIGIWARREGDSAFTFLVNKGGPGGALKWTMCIGNYSTGVPNHPGKPCISFHWQPGVVWVVSDGFDWDSNWHHYVVTCKNGNFSFFMDGKSIGRAFNNSPIPANSEPLRLGRSGDGEGLFKGSIDEARIYNRALSDAEVKALYDYESTPPDNSFITKGLVAYYPFNGNENDESGKNNSVVAVGLSYSTNRFGMSKGSAHFSNFNQNANANIIDLPLNSKAKTISLWYQANFDSLQASGKDAGDLFTIKNPSNITNALICRLNLPANKPSAAALITFQAYGVGGIYYNIERNQGWNQIVIKYSEQFLKFFYNGVLVDVNFVNLATPGNWLTIGGDEQYYGSIDDFRIYDRALSDAEIKTLYIYELTPPNIVPVFATQPQPQSIITGNDATFCVTLKDAGSYNYQWQRNEQNIAGATLNCYTVNSVTASMDGGRYRAIVSNSAGTIISDSATLNVVTPPPPIIATQPTPKTVQEGANVNFNVVASGQGTLVYQWQFNEQNLPGATSATLNLNGVKLNTAGRYRVLVSSQYGVTISDTVTLTVNPNPPPTIVTQPLSRTSAEGTQVSLTVTATGLGALTYQWQINNQNIPGATTSTLVLSAVRPSANGKYRVIIGNPYGTTISTEATVAVVVTDADSDGLSDYEELLLGTNANKADSDGDGLTDFAEVRTHGSNPLTTDTDGDGYSDGIEVARDGNPNNRSVTPTGALAVFPAVDVEFYTLNGVKYQLEVSTDMVSWTAQGGLVVGNGGSQNHLVRASKATQFWRLKVVQ